MSRTDERIREEIRRLADPPDPAGALDRVERLVARKAIARRAQTAGLAAFVVTGTLLGVLGLTRLFERRPPPPTAPARPVGELIVFHEGSGGNLDLYSVRPDGSGRRRLTDEPGSDVYPALSPDGERIAFASDRTGRLGIYVMPAGGGPAVALIDTSAESYDPAWSPDGRRIAFASNRTGNGDIYVMDADGSNLTRLTGDDPRSRRGFEGAPAWSPDGRRIAFVAEVDGSDAPESEGNIEIFVMDADGSNVVRVTEDPAGNWDPAWSPDGAWIALHSSRGQSGSDIYVVRPDGTGLARLTDDPARDIQPAWSPEGSRIVFASDRNGALRLFVMDADGSNVVPLAGGEAAGPTWGRAAAAPQPDETGSPDGTTPPDETPAGACDESTVRGDFDGDGQPDSATVLRARCSVLTEPAEWAIELEWSTSQNRGGGTLAAGAWPVRECVEWCQALGAPDLDGNGLDELAIQTVAFSIHIFHVYTALPFATGPVPLRVAPPGDPEGGFEPGAVPTFSAGGDAFWTYNVRCDRRAEGRVIVVTAAESLPHDSPDAVWHVRETVLDLSDGEFEVVSVRTYTVPTDDPEERALFFDDADLCGAPIAGGGPG